MLSDLQTKKLTRYFQVYDIDDDGRIAATDFERIIENVRVLHGAGNGSKGYDGLRVAYVNLWNRLREGADGDLDGGIDLDEWLAYWVSSSGRRNTSGRCGDGAKETSALGSSWSRADSFARSSDGRTQRASTAVLGGRCPGGIQ